MAWSVASLPSPPGVSAQKLAALAQPWTANDTDSAQAKQQQQPEQEPDLTPHRITSFKGSGLAVLRSEGTSVEAQSSAPSRATFSHLEFSFPLKLIHPRTSSHNASAQINASSSSSSTSSPARIEKTNGVAALYIVSYGGGLVSGDRVELDIDVGPGCTLLTLTQGSTKVFKMRRPPQQQEHSSPSVLNLEWTSQSFRYLVRPKALLLVLPDPVTPYSSARYAQTQRFDLRCAHTSHLVVLDWFTPGRVRYQQTPLSQGEAEKEGELWDFAAYSSRNEFRIAGNVVARDALLLEHPLQQGHDRANSHQGKGNALAHAMHPFIIYGTLFLYAPSGPVRRIVDSLRAEFSKIEQRRMRRSTPAASGSSTTAQHPTRPDPFSAETVYGQGGVEAGQVLWSLSDLPFQSQPIPATSSSASQPSVEKQNLTVVRLAGTSTEAVRRWLALRLSLLEELVGPDLYKAALVT
ncbi:hypothetical protein A4X13_0g4185 [Tilletia indica]|uniref:Urease accessory protein UreD n=1 Tax=Tilletia indica TaxID=43049 RepID=A0A177TQN0_9BASI|nr:hypothetical protein A4X13_0g4185 [Tilletia indica]